MEIVASNVLSEKSTLCWLKFCYIQPPWDSGYHKGQKEQSNNRYQQKRFSWLNFGGTIQVVVVIDGTIVGQFIPLLGGNLSLNSLDF